LKAGNDLTGSGYLLKHRFLDIEQIAFYDSRTEHQFLEPFDSLKHSFLYLDQVACWDTQKGENEFERLADA
jgi:hypothetical protein